MQEEERRKRTRVPVKFDVTISIHGEMIDVKTLNISLTGILCSADTRFHNGVECRVTITLDSDIQMVIQGKILRAGPDETAIAFMSMDEETFAHLKKLVQYNAGDADEIDAEISTPAFS